ncbi:MAG TPA: cytochrome P450 [Pseudonocardiaceae bacterium]
MTQAPDISDIPGRSGPEESLAAAEGGGFGWSEQRAAEFGDVCRTTFLGQDAVLLTGEVGIRAFYDTERVARAGVLPQWAIALLGDGVVNVVPSLDGEPHTNRKHALLRAMAPEALRVYLPAIDAVVSGYAEQWEQAKEVDWIQELQRMAFFALSQVITGTGGSDDLLAKYRQVSETLFGGGDHDAGVVARDGLLSWYRNALAGKRRPGELPTDVMGVLAHNGDLTDEQIVAETQHMFVGSGGVWRVCCNLLAFMESRPELLDRARTEIGTFGIPPSFEDLAGSTYLQSLVEETARLTPAINVQMGRTVQPLEIHGFTVPAGTLVLGGFHATNLSPRIYAEAGDFNPARPGCPYSKSSPFTYVPFGGGDARTGHRCLGEQLVYLTVKAVLSRLARDYTWTAIKPEELRAVAYPSLAKVFSVRFERTV